MDLFTLLVGGGAAVGGSAISAVLVGTVAYIVGRRHGGAAPLVDPGNTKPALDTGRDMLFSIFEAIEKRYGLTPAAQAGTTAAQVANAVAGKPGSMDIDAAFKQATDVIKQLGTHLAASNQLLANAAGVSAPPASGSTTAP